MNTTKSMVLALRDAKQRAGLSYETIVDLTEKNGEAVSLSTVRRVLAPSSTEFDFRYDTTILPIANALGVTFDKPDETEDQDMNQALTIIKETYEARIEDLWKHITVLRRDRVVLGVVIILLIAFIAYLFADGLNGHWGIFQYPV